MFEVLLISLIAIFFRIIQLTYNRYLLEYFKFDPVGDAATYIFLIQFFRKNNCGVSDSRCLIGNSPVLTPSLYLKIVGFFFNDKTLSERAWLPNFIIFSLGVPLGFVFYAPFIDKFGLNIPNSFYFMSFLLSFFVFLIQADNSNYGEQRIHFWTVQPRFLALVSCSLAWLSYFAIEDTFFQMAFMSFFFCISLNISYFPRQAVFFVTIGYFIFSGDFYPLSGFLISFICSALLFKDEFLPSIIPQLGYLINYFKNTPKSNNKGGFLYRLIKHTLARPSVEIINYLIFTLSIILVTVIYFDRNDRWLWGHDDFLLKYLSFLLSVFLIYFLTSLRFFSSLGESWRYIAVTNYYLPYFSFPIILYYFIQDYFLVSTFIVFLGLLQKFIGNKFSKVTFSNDNKYLKPLLQRNKEEIKNARWYGIPYKISNYCVSNNFGKTTFEFQYGNNPESLTKEFFEDTVPWHTLRRDKNFIEKHRVSHVLLHKDYEFDEKKESRLPKVNLSLLDENSYFAIFKVNY